MHKNEELARSPDDFAELLRDLKSKDCEYSHVRMDEEIVVLLRSLGYSKAMDEYESQCKWYA